MKLDPRERPTAAELLQDEWFTERSERTVGWYSKEDWQQIPPDNKVTHKLNRFRSIRWRSDFLFVLAEPWLFRALPFMHKAHPVPLTWPWN